MMGSNLDLIHLALEIERESVPLSGRVTGDRGRVRSFTGWTGLAAALTALLEEVEMAPASDEPVV